MDFLVPHTKAFVGRVGWLDPHFPISVSSISKPRGATRKSTRRVAIPVGPSRPPPRPCRLSSISIPTRGDHPRTPITERNCFAPRDGSCAPAYLPLPLPPRPQRSYMPAALPLVSCSACHRSPASTFETLLPLAPCARPPLSPSSSLPSPSSYSLSSPPPSSSLPPFPSSSSLRSPPPSPPSPASSFSPFSRKIHPPTSPSSRAASVHSVPCHHLHLHRHHHHQRHGHHRRHSYERRSVGDLWEGRRRRRVVVVGTESVVAEEEEEEQEGRRLAGSQQGVEEGGKARRPPSPFARARHWTKLCHSVSGILSISRMYPRASAGASSLSGMDIGIDTLFFFRKPNRRRRWTSIRVYGGEVGTVTDEHELGCSPSCTSPSPSSSSSLRTTITCHSMSLIPKLCVDEGLVDPVALNLQSASCEDCVNTASTTITSSSTSTSISSSSCASSSSLSSIQLASSTVPLQILPQIAVVCDKIADRAAVVGIEVCNSPPMEQEVLPVAVSGIQGTTDPTSTSVQKRAREKEGEEELQILPQIAVVSDKIAHRTAVAGIEICARPPMEREVLPVAVSSIQRTTDPTSMSVQKSAREKEEEEELAGMQEDLAKRKLSGFSMRLAQGDEQLWAASWLRAESYCDSTNFVSRYIDSFKKRFAEQEFSALKKRTVTKHGRFLKCACIVAILQSSNSHANLVKSEGAETGNEATDCARTEERVSDDIVNAVKLVVGTLDVSIRQLTPGERIPGEIILPGSMELAKPRKFGYIANVCVAKRARRRGIASGLLDAAIDIAHSWGLKELYVHVNASNKAARNLYMKIGFQVAGESRVQTGKQSANVPMEKIILMKMHL